MKLQLVFFAVAVTIAAQSHAIIIIPIPNLAFPPAIAKIRDALENSTDTKALATAGEAKTFGSRQWVWGHVSGKMTQEEADTQALSKCNASLRNQKSQSAGGQPIYDFGNNVCELYKFKNVTLNLPDTTPVATPNVMVAPGAPKEPNYGVVPAPAPASNLATVPQIPATSTSIPSQATAANPALVISPSAPESTAKSKGDIVQRMKDLDSLLKQGLITSDDYNRKKKQFLDEM